MLTLDPLKIFFPGAGIKGVMLWYGLLGLSIKTSTPVPFGSISNNDTQTSVFPVILVAGTPTKHSQGLSIVLTLHQLIVLKLTTSAPVTSARS